MISSATPAFLLVFPVLLLGYNQNDHYKNDHVNRPEIIKF